MDEKMLHLDLTRPFNCPLTLSNYMHDAYIILSVLNSRWWLPITFQNFVIVLINDGNRAEWGTIRRNYASD